MPLQLPIFDAMRSQILAELLRHHRFVIGPVADVRLDDGVAFGEESGENLCQLVKSGHFFVRQSYFCGGEVFLLVLWVE